jgi:GNAT superfamily N-acetyltransferase
VQLREWNPSTATGAELHAWVKAHNAALATDLPGDPPWSVDLLREYLTVTMPGESRLTWLAEEGDEVLAYGRLLIMGRLGVLELYVVPAGRRNRVGETLLGEMAACAVKLGLTSLAVEAVGGTPSVEFYTRLGFARAYTEMRSLLELSEMDWEHVSEMAEGISHGYLIEYYPGDLPDALLPAYAEAKQVRRLAPEGDLELRPSSYDAERLRTSLRCLNARGLRPYIVVAIHERSERVAGLTELVVPAQHPTRADQYDTIIVPEHNGYGLARALKGRMLMELRTAEPGLLEVQTWHAVEREQLQQVNKELGFRPDREWHEYEVDARLLAQRLSR